MRAVSLAVLLALAAAFVAGCAPSAEHDYVAESDPALDSLFARLRSAQTPTEAGILEEQIWQAWARSGSATVDVLIERADAADAAGDKALAARYVDEAAAILPSYAGAWYRRSILRYDLDDRSGAIRDIQETLKREPRHFAALTGLGLIYEDMGQERAALEAYRHVLAIHPFVEEARQGVRRLETKIEGVEL
jgi:tetratricopeptide (TPR) repeat protein